MATRDGSTPAIERCVRQFRLVARALHESPELDFARALSGLAESLNRPTPLADVDPLGTFVPPPALPPQEQPRIPRESRGVRPGHGFDASRSASRAAAAGASARVRSPREASFAARVPARAPSHVSAPVTKESSRAQESAPCAEPSVARARAVVAVSSSASVVAPQGLASAPRATLMAGSHFFEHRGRTFERIDLSGAPPAPAAAVTPDPVALPFGVPVRAAPVTSSAAPVRGSTAASALSMGSAEGTASSCIAHIDELTKVLLDRGRGIDVTSPLPPPLSAFSPGPRSASQSPARLARVAEELPRQLVRGTTHGAQLADEPSEPDLARHPEMSAASVAGLVNEALIEQALLYGVDLS